MFNTGTSDRTDVPLSATSARVLTFVVNFPSGWLLFDTVPERFVTPPTRFVTMFPKEHGGFGHGFVFESAYRGGTSNSIGTLARPQRAVSCAGSHSCRTNPVLLVFEGAIPACSFVAPSLVRSPWFRGARGVSTSPCVGSDLNHGRTCSLRCASSLLQTRACSLVASLLTAHGSRRSPFAFEASLRSASHCAGPDLNRRTPTGQRPKRCAFS